MPRLTPTISLLALPLLLLTITTTYLSHPPTTNISRPKIFILGLSKTGTTSLGDALALLGYKRLGWKDIRSRALVHAYIHHDLAPLRAQTQYFDAFEDLPWPFLYRELAGWYPDARFLLTLRRDEETWLGSMRTHVGRGVWGPYEDFYGATAVEGNEAVVLGAYRNHTQSVREFFRGQPPERFAELKIDGDGVGDAEKWEVLCQLTECCPEGHVPSIPFPKSNQAANWSKNVVVDNLHWFWSWSITRIEELSVASVYGGGWSGVNYVLGACWKVVDVIEQACSELTHQYIMSKAKLVTFVPKH